jgi:hypothetical protein
MCPAGTTMCGGGCTNRDSDPLNCGDCGVVCAVDEACIAGNCRAVRVATGCTACPCPTCVGDFTRCCNAMASGVAPLCVEGGGCPAGFSAP